MPFRERTRKTGTSQFWSLSIEEHFYFMLPALLVFLPMVRRRALLVLTLVCYAWIALLLYVPSSRPPNEFWGQRTEFSLPVLLVPALYALLLQWPAVLQGVRRYLTPMVGLACAAVVVWSQSIGYPRGWELLPMMIIAAVFPLVLLSTIHHPRHTVSRVLEWAPLKWVGRLSYSIYLWQELFFTREHRYPAYPIHFLEQPGWNLVCLMTCAVASYYLVEKPCIRLGQRWSTKCIPRQDVVARG